MTLIKALLKDQVLTLIETPVIASGGVEEDVVSFDFGIDAAWEGYTKKAVFYRDESDVYHVDIGSDNTAVIPWEVLQQEGFMFLGVFGTKGSEIKTSTVARYRVENGAITIGSESQPTPNFFADIIANTAARHRHGNKDVLDGITSEKVMEWNGKSDFSGSYNDLTDKPTIPDISGKQDKLIAGEGITIAADGKTISASGKVSSVNGKTGAVTLNVEDIHYANSSRTLDGTIGGLELADAQMESDISKLKTADASLDSRITAIETGSTPVTLYIYWASIASGGRVSLTRNGAAMSVTDFISKMQSGA